jgi:O-antigen/teichoic acid export membrane protein
MINGIEYKISDSAKLTSSLIAGKIIALLVTFAMPLFLTRYLSKNEYGLFSQFYLVVNFIAIFFSIRFQSNLFYFYPISSSTDRKSLVFLTFVFLTIFSFAAIGFTSFPLIQKEVIGDSELIRLYPFIIIGIILIVPSYLIEPLYVVRKDYLTSILYPPCEALLRLLLVIVMVIIKPGLRSICTGLICAAAVSYIFVLIYLFKELKLKDINWKLIDFSIIKKQLLFVLPFGMAMSLDTLSERFDRIICIKYLTPADFAIYSIAFFGIPGILQVYDSFTKVQVIEMTIKYQEKKMDKISEIYKSLATKAFSFSVPLLMIVFLYAKKIIVLLFTSRYLDSVPFFRIYLFSFIFFMLGAGLILRATGRTTDTLKSYLYSSVLTFPATLLLIKSYGMWGAMTSALLNLMIPRILMIAFEIRYLNIGFKSHYPWKKIFQIILISFFPLVPFIVIENFFNSGVAVTIFYGILYLIIVALLQLKNDLFILPRDFVISRIGVMGLKSGFYRHFGRK